jgi:hypothetical protein
MRLGEVNIRRLRGSIHLRKPFLKERILVEIVAIWRKSMRYRPFIGIFRDLTLLLPMIVRVIDS